MTVACFQEHGILAMPFLGTLVNVLAVLAGSLIGLLIGHRLPPRLKAILLDGLGIGTLLVGLNMALKTGSELLVIGALLLGGIAGELLRIEQALEGLADRLRQRVKSESPTFISGFVSATLLFCVGPLTIIGAFEDGMGQPKLLLIKSMLDLFSSLALSSALGVGVVFSALSVLVIQGCLAAGGMLMGQAASEAMIVEISAVGGLMIVGIGINLLGLKKVAVANFLPAFVFIPLLMWLAGLFGQ